MRPPRDEKLVGKCLDLTTSHVPSPTTTNFGTRSVSFEFGWIVWVFPQATASELPGWFRPIHQRAVEEECLVIVFDRDSSNEGPWPTWDW